MPLSDFRHLPIGILELDRQQVIRAADPRFCELFECTAEDVVGCPFDELLNARDRRSASTYYSRLSRYDGGLIDVHLALSIGGREFYARARMKRVDDDWVVYLENTLVEQDLTYQMVVAQERWLSVHLSSEDGIVILDPDKRIVEHNARLLDILRFQSQHGIPLSAQAISGKLIFDLLGDSGLPGLEAALDRAKLDRRTTFHEVIERVERVLDVRMRPLILPVRGFIGSCVVIRDVTQQKRLEQMRIHQAQAHFAGMAELATNIVHNLGNICTNVIFSAEELLRISSSSKVSGLGKATDLLDRQEDLAHFLTRDPNGHKLRDYLRILAQRLESENATLRDETRDLLAKVHLMKDVIASQQDYARGIEVMEPVDLVEVIDDALRIQKMSLDRHEVAITKKLAPTPLVRGQRLKLLHVLMNLIKNAKEAMSETPSSHRRLTLELGRGADDSVELRVVDVGHGIAEATKQKMFAHGFTTKESGHGFGLHFCATAVHEMGGTLSADSGGEGCGATFTVVFPRSTLAVP